MDRLQDAELHQPEQTTLAHNRIIRRTSALVALVLVALLIGFALWSTQRNSIDIPVAPGIQQPSESPSDQYKLV